MLLAMSLLLNTHVGLFKHNYMYEVQYTFKYFKLRMAALLYLRHSLTNEYTSHHTDIQCSMNIIDRNERMNTIFHNK